MAKNEFRVNRVKKLQELYADEASTRRRYNQSVSRAGRPATAAAVRTLLVKSLQNKDDAVKLSKEIFATNPIYANVINYLSNMYMWRYKVTPHKTFKKSKAQLRKKLVGDDFELIYDEMLEAVDGLSIETKFPALLSMLFIEGAVFFTTFRDEESITLDTLILPNKYCRKIAETQYGTAIIEFNYSYFNDLGLSEQELTEYLKSFPKDFAKGYKKYKANSNEQWQQLDPHFSSGVLLNENEIPTYLYILGGILDYEKYQDNELERNENLLKYIVVQTMPIYQDKLVFEMDEVDALHKSLKNKIEKSDKVNLMTTFGDTKVLKVSENDTVANEVLSKAFKAIFNNAGFNSSIFTAESVEALKMSLIRDKGMVWRYVNAFLNFYSIAINNWFDFKGYEADIAILPISPYTYADDIKIYKDNATLGVGKLDYIIASGIKQRSIQDNFTLEKFLKLDDITPMQTSYTQTAQDRQDDTGDNKEKKEDSEDKSGVEPLDESKKSSTDEDK